MCFHNLPLVSGLLVVTLSFSDPTGSSCGLAADSVRSDGADSGMIK